MKEEKPKQVGTVDLTRDKPISLLSWEVQTNMSRKCNQNAYSYSGTQLNPIRSSKPPKKQHTDAEVFCISDSEDEEDAKAQRLNSKLHSQRKVVAGGEKLKHLPIVLVKDEEVEVETVTVESNQNESNSREDVLDEVRRETEILREGTQPTDKQNTSQGKISFSKENEIFTPEVNTPEVTVDSSESSEQNTSQNSDQLLTRNHVEPVLKNVDKEDSGKNEICTSEVGVPKNIEHVLENNEQCAETEKLKHRESDGLEKVSITTVPSEKESMNLENEKNEGKDVAVVAKADITGFSKSTETVVSTIAQTTEVPFNEINPECLKSAEVNSVIDDNLVKTNKSKDVTVSEGKPEEKSNIVCENKTKEPEKVSSGFTSGKITVETSSEVENETSGKKIAFDKVNVDTRKKTTGKNDAEVLCISDSEDEDGVTVQPLRDKAEGKAVRSSPVVLIKDDEEEEKHEEPEVEIVKVVYNTNTVSNKDIVLEVDLRSEDAVDDKKIEDTAEVFKTDIGPEDKQKPVEFSGAEVAETEALNTSKTLLRKEDHNKMAEEKEVFIPEVSMAGNEQCSLESDDCELLRDNHVEPDVQQNIDVSEENKTCTEEVNKSDITADSVEEQSKLPDTENKDHVVLNLDAQDAVSEKNETCTAATTNEDICENQNIVSARKLSIDQVDSDVASKVAVDEPTEGSTERAAIAILNGDTVDVVAEDEVAKETRETETERASTESPKENCLTKVDAELDLRDAQGESNVSVVGDDTSSPEVVKLAENHEIEHNESSSAKSEDQEESEEHTERQSDSISGKEVKEEGNKNIAAVIIAEIVESIEEAAEEKRTEINFEKETKEQIQEDLVTEVVSENKPKEPEKILANSEEISAGISNEGESAGVHIEPEETDKTESEQNLLSEASKNETNGGDETNITTCAVQQETKLQREPDHEDPEKSTTDKMYAIKVSKTVESIEIIDVEPEQKAEIVFEEQRVESFEISELNSTVVLENVESKLKSTCDTSQKPEQKVEACPTVTVQSNDTLTDDKLASHSHSHEATKENFLKQENTVKLGEERKEKSRNDTSKKDQSSKRHSPGRYHEPASQKQKEKKEEPKHTEKSNKNNKSKYSQRRDVNKTASCKSIDKKDVKEFKCTDTSSSSCFLDEFENFLSSGKKLEERTNTTKEDHDKNESESIFSDISDGPLEITDDDDDDVKLDTEAKPNTKERVNSHKSEKTKDERLHHSSLERRAKSYDQFQNYRKSRQKSKRSCTVDRTIELKEKGKDRNFDKRKYKQDSSRNWNKQYGEMKGGSPHRNLDSFKETQHKENLKDIKTLKSPHKSDNECFYLGASEVVQKSVVIDDKQEETKKTADKANHIGSKDRCQNLGLSESDSLVKPTSYVKKEPSELVLEKPTEKNVETVTINSNLKKSEELTTHFEQPINICDIPLPPEPVPLPLEAVPDKTTLNTEEIVPETSQHASLFILEEKPKDLQIINHIHRPSEMSQTQNQIENISEKQNVIVEDVCSQNHSSPTPFTSEAVQSEEKTESIAAEDERSLFAKEQICELSAESNDVSVDTNDKVQKDCLQKQETVEQTVQTSWTKPLPIETSSIVGVSTPVEETKEPYYSGLHMLADMANVAEKKCIVQPSSLLNQDINQTFTRNHIHQEEKFISINKKTKQLDTDSSDSSDCGLMIDARNSPSHDDKPKVPKTTDHSIMSILRSPEQVQKKKQASLYLRQKEQGFPVDLSTDGCKKSVEPLKVRTKAERKEGHDVYYQSENKGNSSAGASRSRKRKGSSPSKSTQLKIQLYDDIMTPVPDLTEQLELPKKKARFSEDSPESKTTKKTKEQDIKKGSKDKLFKRENVNKLVEVIKTCAKMSDGVGKEEKGDKTKSMDNGASSTAKPKKANDVILQSKGKSKSKKKASKEQPVSAEKVPKKIPQKKRELRKSFEESGIIDDDAPLSVTKMLRGNASKQKNKKSKKRVQSCRRSPRHLQNSNAEVQIQDSIAEVQIQSTSSEVKIDAVIEEPSKSEKHREAKVKGIKKKSKSKICEHVKQDEANTVKIDQRESEKPKKSKEETENQVSAEEFQKGNTEENHVQVLEVHKDNTIAENTVIDNIVEIATSSSAERIDVCADANLSEPTVSSDNVAILEHTDICAVEANDAAPTDTVIIEHIDMMSTERANIPEVDALSEEAVTFEHSDVVCTEGANVTVESSPPVVVTAADSQTTKDTDSLVLDPLSTETITQKQDEILIGGVKETCSDIQQSVDVATTEEGKPSVENADDKATEVSKEIIILPQEPSEPADTAKVDAANIEECNDIRDFSTLKDDEMEVVTVIEMVPNPDDGNNAKCAVSDPPDEVTVDDHTNVNINETVPDPIPLPVAEISAIKVADAPAPDLSVFTENILVPNPSSIQDFLTSLCLSTAATIKPVDTMASSGTVFFTGDEVDPLQKVPDGSIKISSIAETTVSSATSVITTSDIVAHDPTTSLEFVNEIHYDDFEEVVIPLNDVEQDANEDAPHSHSLGPFMGQIEQKAKNSSNDDLTALPEEKKNLSTKMFNKPTDGIGEVTQTELEDNSPLNTVVPFPAEPVPFVNELYTENNQVSSVNNQVSELYTENSQVPCENNQISELYPEDNPESDVNNQVPCENNEVLVDDPTFPNNADQFQLWNKKELEAFFSAGCINSSFPEHDTTAIPPNDEPNFNINPFASYLPVQFFGEAVPPPQEQHTGIEFKRIVLKDYSNSSTESKAEENQKTAEGDIPIASDGVESKTEAKLPDKTVKRKVESDKEALHGIKRRRKSSADQQSTCGETKRKREENIIADVINELLKVNKEAKSNKKSPEIKVDAQTKDAPTKPFAEEKPSEIKPADTTGTNDVPCSSSQLPDTPQKEEPIRTRSTNKLTQKSPKPTEDIQQPERKPENQPRKDFLKISDIVKKTSQERKSPRAESETEVDKYYVRQTNLTRPPTSGRKIKQSPKKSETDLYQKPLNDEGKKVDVFDLSASLKFDALVRSTEKGASKKEAESNKAAPHRKVEQRVLNFDLNEKVSLSSANFDPLKKPEAKLKPEVQKRLNDPTKSARATVTLTCYPDTSSASSDFDLLKNSEDRNQVKLKNLPEIQKGSSDVAKSPRVTATSSKSYGDTSPNFDVRSPEEKNQARLSKTLPILKPEGLLNLPKIPRISAAANKPCTSPPILSVISDFDLLKKSEEKPQPRPSKMPPNQKPELQKKPNHTAIDRNLHKSPRASATPTRNYADTTPPVSSPSSNFDLLKKSDEKNQPRSSKTPLNPKPESQKRSSEPPMERTLSRPHRNATPTKQQGPKRPNDPTIHQNLPKIPRTIQPVKPHPDASPQRRYDTQRRGQSRSAPWSAYPDNRSPYQGQSSRGRVYPQNTRSRSEHVARPDVRHVPAGLTRLVLNENGS